MPAGTDLITFSPRVGASGDDRYTVPDDTVIAAGISTYSSTPTISEINSGSGINQLIAEINRRVDMYEDSDGSNSIGSHISYVTAGTSKILASLWTSMKSYIDAIRSAEGQSAYSWTQFPVSASVKILADQVFELREALAYDRIRLRTYRPDTSVDHVAMMIRYDRSAAHPADPSGTPSTSQFPHVGDAHEDTPDVYASLRTVFTVKVPSGLPTINSAKMLATKKASGLFTGTSFGSYTMELWHSTSYLAPYTTGDWGNLNNAEGSLVISSEATAQIEIDLSNMPASGNHTYWLVGQEERLDSSIGSDTRRLVAIEETDGMYVDLYT